MSNKELNKIGEEIMSKKESFRSIDECKEIKKTSDEIRRDKLVQDYDKLSDKKRLEYDYKFIASSYRLLSESLHQGKNTYLLGESLEFLEVKIHKTFDLLKELEDKEKKT